MEAWSRGQQQHQHERINPQDEPERHDPQDELPPLGSEYDSSDNESTRRLIEEVKKSDLEEKLVDYPVTPGPLTPLQPR